MYKQNSEGCNLSEVTDGYYSLLNEKVTSEDIYNIYKIINNAQNVDEDIIELENQLLINSFCKEKKLFSDRFVYYSFASVIINVGVFTNDLNQVEMSFKKLLKIINIIFDDSNKLSYKQKMKLFNTSCLKCEEICHQLMNVSGKDIENEFSRIIYIIYSSLNDCRIFDSENDEYKKIKERKIS